MRPILRLILMAIALAVIPSSVAAQDDDTGPRPAAELLKDIKWFWPDGDVDLNDGNCRKYTDEFFQAYPLALEPGQPITDDIVAWYSRPYLARAYQLRGAGFVNESLEIADWMLDEWPQTDEREWFLALKLSLHVKLGQQEEAARVATELFDERFSRPSFRSESGYHVPEYGLWRDMAVALTGSGDYDRANRFVPALKQLVADNPDMLSQVEFYDTCIEICSFSGDLDEALRWAAMGFRVCPYYESTIDHMIEAIKKTLLPVVDLDFAHVDQVENYLRTGEGDNPLAGREFGPFAEDATRAIFANSSADLRPQIPVYLYVGWYLQAAQNAKWLLGARTLEPPVAALEMARCLRAADGHLGRSSIFMNYVATREGKDALAQIGDDFWEGELFPGSFSVVWPTEFRTRCRLGEPENTTFTVIGNASLKIRRAGCELPWVNATVGGASASDVASSYELDLTLTPDKRGRYRTALEIETNMIQDPVVRVPLEVDVWGPIIIRPDSFFFGFVKPGETKTATVTLTGNRPFESIDTSGEDGDFITFEITATQVDRPELISVEVLKESDHSYIIEAALRAPAEPGSVEGNVELSTGLESQPTVALPYYVHIPAAE